MSECFPMSTAPRNGTLIMAKGDNGKGWPVKFMNSTHQGKGWFYCTKTGFGLWAIDEARLAGWRLFTDADREAA